MLDIIEVLICLVIIININIKEVKEIIFNVYLVIVLEVIYKLEFLMNKYY